MSSAIIQDTRHLRAGRRFEPRHELALIGRARDISIALPGAARGLVVIGEMTGPIGIPDLTALVGDPALLDRRRALTVPPLLNEIDAGVVAVSHARVARSASAIARALGWPVETVRRRIPALLRSGALSEVRPDRFTRPPDLRPLGRLYAIEAKVRGWRRALRQVRTYTVWADSYVLVMGPQAPLVLDQLSREVRADRGGLVIDGRWLLRPSVHRLPLARRLWAAEHLVASLHGDGDQPSSIA